MVREEFRQDTGFAPSIQLRARTRSSGYRQPDVPLNGLFDLTVSPSSTLHTASSLLPL
jgi:hypothetical protein